MWVFPGGTSSKQNLPASAGDLRDVASIPGLGRCLGEGLETHSSIHAWRIPKDRGAWWATVHRSHSWTWLKWLSMHTPTSLCSIAKMSHVIINCISIKDSTVERNHIKLMYVIFNIYWIEFLFYAKPIDIKKLVRHCYKHSMSIEYRCRLLTWKHTWNGKGRTYYKSPMWNR